MMALEERFSPEQLQNGWRCPHRADGLCAECSPGSGRCSSCGAPLDDHHSVKTAAVAGCPR